MVPYLPDEPTIATNRLSISSSLIKCRVIDIADMFLIKTFISGKGGHG